MIRLFIDTVSNKNRVFLFNDKKILQEKTWIAKQNEAEKLLPAIQDLLKKEKKTFSDISLISCITGPGKFTSTRIGIVVANALSYSLSIPIIGIDLFQSFAHRIKDKNIFPIDIFIESNRNDFFYTKLLSISKKSDLDVVSKITNKKTNKIVIKQNGDIESNIDVKNFLDKKDGIISFLNNKKNWSNNQIVPIYIREANITKRKKL